LWTFRMSISMHKRNDPLLQTFWWRFWPEINPWSRLPSLVKPTASKVERILMQVNDLLRMELMVECLGEWPAFLVQERPWSVACQRFLMGGFTPKSFEKKNPRIFLLETRRCSVFRSFEKRSCSNGWRVMDGNVRADISTPVVPKGSGSGLSRIWYISCTLHLILMYSYQDLRYKAFVVREGQFL